MKRMLAFALSLALTLPAVSCRDTTGPGGSLIGTYSLRLVNNRQLPAPLYYINVNNHVEIVSGTLTLNSNGDYTQDITGYDTNNAPTQTFTDRFGGRWSLSGNEVALIDSYDGSIPMAPCSTAT